LNKIAVIVLNWNGEEDSLVCIDALKKQSLPHSIIAVDNGSTDNFVSKMEKIHPDIVLLKNSSNLGFAGGENTGIKYAIDHGLNYVALINNDAFPDKNWLKELVKSAGKNPKAGIVTGKLLKIDGTIDSTGDRYTSWGLAYPRGRGEEDSGLYDEVEEVFAGSGGASLYRIDMLKQTGLFDEDFFAYYEDVDLSFRAQLGGWKVVYTPTAIAHHKIGASSSKVSGLTTYMTIKNLPWLLWKNVPLRLMPLFLPRFTVAYASIVLSSLAKGKVTPTLKGLAVALIIMPKKLVQRRHIQSRRTVSTSYIKSIITKDLPPNASKLRRIRKFVKTG